MKPKVFVLVHPAWHGAWFWKKVVPLLRARGHLVFTPTLTGLGERSHLARAEIGLEMHVNDVVNVLKYEDLREVVLVGHSSSGVVITGAADRAPQQIAHVIYLDAFVPEDGQAVLDLITPDRRQSFEGLVKTEGKGWLVPRFAQPPWETIVRDMWGVTHDDDVRWMLDRLGPRPFGISKTLFNARILPPRNYRVPIFVVCSFQTPASTSTPQWHRAPSAGATRNWRPPITRPSPCQTKSRIYCWNLRRDHLHRGRTLRRRTDSRYPGHPAGDRHRTRSFFKSRSQ
jgi:pimeloyl-ACP methyl ester carboxylesterase